MNKFFEDNYNEIILMSKKICRGSHESEDVAHFAISEFLEHERAEELILAGKGMNFISGIIWRSFNSSTSAYHTVYRQKGRVHSLSPNWDEGTTEEYNTEKDMAILAIEGILEDMGADKEHLWYLAQLFRMWIETPNFSELSRRTEIPRTSISQSVEDAKDYIRQQLKIQGINYEL